MDKKAKKKIEVLQQRIQKHRQQLAGAREQDDEPGEIERIEKDIADAEKQIAILRAS